MSTENRLRWLGILLSFVILVGTLFLLVRNYFPQLTQAIPIGFSPSLSGGKLLIGTDDISASGGQNFSLSPDGNKLIFQSKKGTPFLPTYVLIDLATQARREISFSPQAQAMLDQRAGPLGRTGCWDTEGKKVFLPGSDMMTLYFAEVESTQIQWEIIKNPSEDEYQLYYECPNWSAYEIPSVVQVTQLSDREAHIIDVRDPGKILARHKTGLTTSRILIDELTISPDGNWLGYTVHQYRGSFVGATQGYILNISSAETAEPQLLANPVFGPFQWDPQRNSVYTAARGLSKDSSIYQWSLVY
ncbi:MAG: hypothetical protein WDZ94_03470 [Patescibacteria group bacterium]